MSIFSLRRRTTNKQARKEKRIKKASMRIGFVDTTPKNGKAGGGQSRAKEEDARSVPCISGTELL